MQSFAMLAASTRFTLAKPLPSATTAQLPRLPPPGSPHAVPVLQPTPASPTRRSFSAATWTTSSKTTASAATRACRSPGTTRHGSLHHRGRPTFWHPTDNPAPSALAASGRQGEYGGVAPTAITAGAPGASPTSTAATTSMTTWSHCATASPASTATGSPREEDRILGGDQDFSREVARQCREWGCIPPPRSEETGGAGRSSTRRRPRRRIVSGLTQIAGLSTPSDSQFLARARLQTRYPQPARSPSATVLLRPGPGSDSLVAGSAPRASFP